MAELSTLSPSPPALGDPHSGSPITASSSAPLLPNSDPPPESLNEKPLPKSSLYNDKALTENLTPAPSEAPSLTPQSSASDSKPTTETLNEGAQQTHESESCTQRDPAIIDHAAPQPLSKNEPPDVSGEPPVQTAELQASVSSDLNPSPNLYPNVQVTHNPNPSLVPEDGQSQEVPVANPEGVPSPAPSKPEESPLPVQQAQNPQSDPVPTSPKPNVSGDARKQELSNTPTRAAPSSPAVPVIQEPPLPNPSPRPAPDTLSYLESASLMSGTLESLSGLGEDGSSVGSDSEINGLTVRRTDKYGFLGGSQYSDANEKDVRVEVARQREMKWLEMFGHWDKWIKQRFQKVKMRCRKGIPSSLRSKAWQLLSNSQDLLNANPGKFEALEREQGEAKWLDIIEKDLHRQFPFHEMFAARGGHGQQDLYRILKAYTVYRPDEGYCQAQAPVAAVLLMHMPAEQAFWCLVQICEKYLPGYYSAGLEAIQLDGEIFFSLLRRTCPMAYRHLKKFKIDPILYMTEWFMCIFSRTLPWSCVLRVWDMFFCEGVKIVFRVGLVLLKQMLGSVDKLRELQGMYETMERLRNISPDTIREDILVQEVVTLPVTEALIERECSVQVRKWRESRGELTHQPGRRLHGTRAIYEHKRRASAISSGGSFSFLGSPVPPPGPLRASSSLLSLPGFRRSKAPLQAQQKKGSFSGPSGTQGPSPHSPPVLALARGPTHKPPIPPGAAAQKPQSPRPQSPLVAAPAEAPAAAPAAVAAPAVPATPAPTQSPAPPNTLIPSPVIVSEQITPAIPSPTANNSPLQPRSDPGREAAAAGEEDGKKKKKSKEDKKKEKEDEKKKLKEKKDKEKAEKERLKREKLEKDKKRASKKKDKGGEAGEKNGAAAAKDST